MDSTDITRVSSMWNPFGIYYIVQPMMYITFLYGWLPVLFQLHGHQAKCYTRMR